MVIQEGAAFVDPGATADDVEDGDLTGNIIITGVVDTGTPGDYILTYTVADTAGNVTQANRTVTLQGAPVVVPPPPPSSGGGGGSTGLGELAGLGLLVAFGAFRRRRRSGARA